MTALALALVVCCALVCATSLVRPWLEGRAVTTDMQEQIAVLGRTIDRQQAVLDGLETMRRDIRGVRADHDALQAALTARSM